MLTTVETTVFDTVLLKLLCGLKLVLEITSFKFAIFEAVFLAMNALICIEHVFVNL